MYSPAIERWHSPWDLRKEMPLRGLRGFLGGTGKGRSCQGRRYKRCGFDPWVEKIPWKRAWQPTAVFLPGESHEQRSLVGYSVESQRIGHDWEDLARMHRQEAGCVSGSRLRRGKSGLDSMSEPRSHAWFSEMWVAGRKQSPWAPRSPWNRKPSWGRLCAQPSRGPVGVLGGCREQECCFSFALGPKCPPGLPTCLRKWFIRSWYKDNRWGNSGNSVRLYFWELQNHCRW